jgi:Phage Tail Collar Domain
MTNKRRAFIVGSLLTALGVALLASGAPPPPTKKDKAEKELRQELDELKKSFQAFKENADRQAQDISRLSRTSPPVGAVVAFTGEWLPPKAKGERWTEAELGWMLCDGRALAADHEYNSLFAAIGTSWGNGTSGEGAKPAMTRFVLAWRGWVCWERSGRFQASCHEARGQFRESGWIVAGRCVQGPWSPG